MEMRFLIVDDERLALNRMFRLLCAIKPNCDARGFLRPREALEEIQEREFQPDVAFLDIEMPGLSGLELAKRIREASPGTKVVFVTGFSQYALEAYSLHARGYLLKPVTGEALEEELRELKLVYEPSGARIRVQCFGNFEVFVDGAPLSFPRSKAKELFAYLVHRRGASCTVKELSAVLFEDKSYDLKQQNYIQKIITTMMKTFASVDADQIIVKKFNSLAVDPEKLDCDFYRFFKLDTTAVNTYIGEYMAQYSWAEFTIGYLDNFMR